MRDTLGIDAARDGRVEVLPRRQQPDHGAERVDQAGAVGGGHEYILTERMEETPASPATAPARRRLVARLAAIALVAVSLPLATPSIDPGFVPGGGFRGEGDGWANGVLGLFSDGYVSRPMVYLCLLWLAIAIWCVLLAFARDLGLRWTAWTAGILIGLFVLAPPLLSLDLFSYISYARLGTEHGLNPYEYAPAAIPYDEAARRVHDYRDAVSVYGPLFTLGTYPLGLLGVPFALWSLKLLAGVAVAAIAAIVARLARLRGIEPAGAVAFVALNPIVLVQLVGGGHNDALTAAIAMAAIAASLAARPFTSRRRLRARRGDRRSPGRCTRPSRSSARAARGSAGG